MSTVIAPSPPKVLRTISSYCCEWNYRFLGGKYGTDSKNQFAILPGAFSKSIADGHDIPLTMDLDGKSFFARTGNGTLRLSCDHIGLLATADLLDTPLNRELIRKIDASKVRGWSFRFRGTLGRQYQQAGVAMTDVAQAHLDEVCLVVHKVPRQRTRQTPIFLTGGPKEKN